MEPFVAVARLHGALKIKWVSVFLGPSRRHQCHDESDSENYRPVGQEFRKNDQAGINLAHSFMLRSSESSIPDAALISLPGKVTKEESNVSVRVRSNEHTLTFADIAIG